MWKGPGGGTYPQSFVNKVFIESGKIHVFIFRRTCKWNTKQNYDCLGFYQLQLWYIHAQRYQVNCQCLISISICLCNLIYSQRRYDKNRMTTVLHAVDLHILIVYDKGHSIYNIGVLTVNIELMNVCGEAQKRGKDELLASLSNRFVRSHIKFYIYRQYTNIVFILQ